MNKEIDKKEILIHPNNIDITDHLWGAFKNSETEASAHYVVKLCQQKDGWFDFTLEEIEKVYNKAGHKNFDFNNLIDHGYLIKSKNSYKITSNFIFNCAKSNYVEIED